MGRQPCCDKVGLKRGPWTIEEDQKLIGFIVSNGIQCWRLVPKLAGLMRCGKSCRLRWMNYLRPDLKRGGFSKDEEDQIIQLHSQLGNKWSKIASHFPGRTDNEIKNYWNTRIKKRLKLLGIDPVTYKHIQNHNSNITKEDEDQILTSQDQNVLDLTLEKEKLENNDNEAILLAKPSTISSVSFSSSVDESLNSSFEGSNLCWDTFDSFLSWEALYYLDDVLSFS